VGRLDLSRPPRVRSARPADLSAIVALEIAAFPPEDRFPRRAWRRLLTVDSAICLVVAEQAVVLGSVAWLLRAGSGLARMYSLAVHPDARGRGLARLLVAASLRRLPPQVDTLGLEVRSDNGAAVGLYCALGFIETARLPSYYGPGRHGLRMRAARAAVAHPPSPAR
jgi:ribosomal protein S18 acetylase RimI-like enzyme